MICLHCQRETGAYFEVTPKDANGTDRGPAIRLCSTICIVKWAYNYSAHKSAQFVKTAATLPGMAKSMISEALSQITRGPR
jgi:abortive infection bacteriophage resistance protein